MQEATEQVTQALILSYLDYCSMVWLNTTADMIDKLQKIQKQSSTYGSWSFFQDKHY